MYLMWSVIFVKLVTTFRNKSFSKVRNGMNYKSKTDRSYPNKYLETQRLKAIQFLKDKNICVSDLIKILGDKQWENLKKKPSKWKKKQ